LTAARAALVEAIAEAAHWEAEATREQVGRAAEGARSRVEAEAEAALAQREVERLEQLLERTAATTLDFIDLDVDALLAELASRADQVVSAEHYVLMVRVGPGLPSNSTIAASGPRRPVR